jgi:hypothetical protein
MRSGQNSIRRARARRSFAPNDHRDIEARREVVFELNQNEFGIVVIKTVRAGREKQGIRNWQAPSKHPQLNALFFFVVRKRGLEPLSLLGASS